MIENNKQKIGNTTDCQSEEGITVSLIDTISFLLGQLSQKNLDTPNVIEALKDLHFNGKNNMKSYTMFVSQKSSSFLPNGERDYTPDLREQCSNCKRRIEPTEKVFRVEDFSVKPFVYKGNLNRKKREMVAELNKLNHAIYCTNCTSKFDKIISNLK